MKMTLKVAGRQRTIDTSKSASYNVNKVAQLAMLAGGAVLLAGAYKALFK